MILNFLWYLIFYFPGISKFQLYGGDMLLTAAQWSEIEAAANPHDPHRQQRAVVNSDEGKWPDAVVPYEIDSSLSKYTHDTWGLNATVDVSYLSVNSFACIVEVTCHNQLAILVCFMMSLCKFDCNGKTKAYLELYTIRVVAILHQCSLGTVTRWSSVGIVCTGENCPRNKERGSKEEIRLVLRKQPRGRWCWGSP